MSDQHSEFERVDAYNRGYQAGQADTEKRLREPMACGHPRACAVDKATNRFPEHRFADLGCSVCAELERVRITEIQEIEARYKVKGYRTPTIITERIMELTGKPSFTHCLSERSEQKWLEDELGTVHLLLDEVLGKRHPDDVTSSVTRLQMALRRIEERVRSEEREACADTVASMDVGGYSSVKRDAVRAIRERKEPK